MKTIISKAGKIYRKGKRSIALTLAILTAFTSFGWSDSTAFAAVACTNHLEHDSECGYVAAVEGSPCTHVCDETCQSTVLTCGKEAGEEVSRTLVCTSTEEGHVHTDECYEINIHIHIDECYSTACTHVHDESCGYVEAVEGHECEHTCENCSATKKASGSKAGLNAEVAALVERVNALPTAEVIKTYTAEQKETLLAEVIEIGELLDEYDEEGLIDEELYTELYMALDACNEALIGDKAVLLSGAGSDATVEVDNSSSYVPTQIINGEFVTAPWEDFKIGSTKYTNGTSFPKDTQVSEVYPNPTDGGWNTTEIKTLDRWGLFEVWNSGSNNFIEMNAHNSAVLYQDLSTYPGDVIRWTLDHASRGDYGDNNQSMAVSIGKPNGSYPTGVNNNKSLNIVSETMATYSNSGVSGANGYAKDGELANLSLAKTGAQVSEWKTAKGVYIIPAGQNVTRFAFVSTSTNSPDGGNFLDNITFSTLIGNLHATTDHDGVVVTGYWGETDTSKKLVVKFDDTHVSNIDMSSVVGKNFKITIPTASVPTGARLVEIYHQDYASAKKTVEVHNWSYSSAANVITATCDITDCSVGTATLTLSASNATYTGSPVKASVSTTSDFPEALGESSVVYYLADGTTKTTSANAGASAEGKAPVSSGSYVAKITAGGKTAEVSFIIKTNKAASVTIGKNVTYYDTFAAALAAANASTRDCTLTILNSCTHSGTSAINNENGKKITLDVGDADTTLTITATANGQKLLTVSTDVDFVGDGGKIVFDLNGKNSIYGINNINQTGECTLRFFDGFNILAKNGTTTERILCISYKGVCYIYGGKISTSNIQTASTVVCWGGSLYIYGGEFDWNVTGDSSSKYWGGVTDSFNAAAFEIYGGYFNGPLWWGNLNSTEVYKFYGGKFTTNKLKNSENNKYGTIDWTSYIGAGNTINDISEIKDGVTYLYEIVNPNVVTCSAVSENEAHGTASVSALRAQKNSTVVFTATSKKGYAFVKWVDNSGNTVSTAATYSKTVTENTVLKAVFEAADPKFEIPVTVSLNDESLIEDANFTFKIEAETAGAPLPENTTITLANPTQTGRANSVSGKWTITNAPDGTYKYKISQVSSDISNCKIDNGVWYIQVDVEDGEAISYIYKYTVPVIENSEQSFHVSKATGTDANVTTAGDSTTLVIGGGGTSSSDAFNTAAIVSDFAIDFTRDFEAKGTFVAGASADGSAVGFVPNGTQTRDVTSTFGGYLGIYGSTQNKNGIFLEFDAYNNGTNEKCGDAELSGIHFALTETNSSGNASVVNSQYQSMTGNWPTGTGNYEISYSVSTNVLTFKYTIGGSTKTWTYSNPTAHFGTNKAYIILSGSMRRGPRGSYNVPYVGAAPKTEIVFDSFNYLGQKTNYIGENPDCSFVNEIYCSHPNWNYTASGATITANCARTECKYHTDGVNLTILAEDSFASGSVYNGISFADSLGEFNKVTGNNISADSVTYYLEGGVEPTTTENSGSVTSGSAPKNSGVYVAKVFAGGKTASVEFQIYKNASTPTAPDKINVLSHTDLASLKCDALKVTWNGLSNATSYKITVSKNRAFTNIVTGYDSKSVSGTECVITGLSQGTTYYVRVKSVTAAGDSDWSDIVSGSTEVHDSEFSVASGNTKKINAVCKRCEYTSSVELTASDVVYTGEPVEAGLTIAADFPEYVGKEDIVYYLEDGVTKTSASNSGAARGGKAPVDAGKYVAKLRMGNATATVSFQIKQKETEAKPPQSISIYTGTTGGTIETTKCNELLISWSEVSNAAGYVIDVALDSDFTNRISGYAAKEVTGNKLKVTGLDEDTKYYVRLYSKLADGTLSEASETLGKKTSKHDYTYSADTTDARKVNAVCANCGVESSVSVLASNAVYTGSPVAATVSQSAGFPETVTSEDIVYYVINGNDVVKTTTANSGAEGTGKAPVFAGEYIAKVQLRNSLFSRVEGIVNYNITKADQTVAAPVAAAGGVRNNSVILAPVTAHGTVKYAVSALNSAPVSADRWQESTEFTGLLSGTAYYFFAKTEGDDNYNGATSTGTLITTKSETPVSKTPEETGITPKSGPEGGKPADPENPGGPTIPEFYPDDDWTPKPGLYTGDPEFPGTPDGEVVTSYFYEGRGTTTYGPSTVKPTVAGTYYYVISMEDNSSVNITRIPFEIKKKEITGGTGVTPKSDDGTPGGTPGGGGSDPKIPQDKDWSPNPDIFTGTPGFPSTPDPENPGGPGTPTPVIGTLTTTYTYEGREGTTYPAIGGDASVKPTAVGKYNLIITVEDNVKKAVEKIPFEITKKASTPTTTQGTNGPSDGDPVDPGNPGGPKIPRIPSTSLPITSPVPGIIQAEPAFETGGSGTKTVTYEYEGRAETVYARSTTAPTLVGKYYLVVTMEDDVNLSVERFPFEIKKTQQGTDTGVTPKAPETPVTPGTEPEIPYGKDWNPNPDIYDGTPGFPDNPAGTPTPVVGTLVTTHTYEGRDGTTYGPSTEKPTEVGKYNLIIRVEDSEKSAVQTIPFEIVASAPEDIPESAYDTDGGTKKNSNVINETIEGKHDGIIKIVDTTIAYEYSTDNKASWTTVPVGTESITGLAAGKVYLRKKATDSRLAGDAVEITVGQGIYAKLGESKWTTLLHNLTFGKFFNSTQKVTLERLDISNGIKEIKYYVSDAEMTEAQLNALLASAWSNYNKLTGVSLNPTSKQVAYFKITDNSDTVTYISSDGYYIDSEKPVFVGIASDTTYTKEDGLTFTVVEPIIKDVVATKSDSTTAELTAVNGRYVLPTGTYSSIKATDLAGNETVLTNVVVKAGQNQPELSDPIVPDDPSDPSGGGKPASPTSDGGPYVTYDPSDGESPGKPVIKYTYSPKNPGTVDAILLPNNEDTEYEIYLGPLGGDGKPTNGPVTGNPTMNLPTDTTIYIRKKATTDPAKEPSEFTPYVIPGVPTTTVTVNPTPANGGTVTLDDPYYPGNSGNPRKFYVGKEIKLYAQPKSGFVFNGWIDTRTGEVISTANPYIFTPNNPDDVNYISAGFVAEGANVISVPYGSTTVRYTYDGTQKTGCDVAALPEHVTLKEGDVTGTEAGTYTYTLKLDDGYKWDDGTTAPKTVTWFIDRQNNTPAPTAVYKKADKKVTVGNIPGGRKIEYKYGSNGPVTKSGVIESGTTGFYPTSTGDSTGSVLAGEYYVRIAGDENNNPSPWTKVTVGNDNVVITVLPDTTGEPDGGAGTPGGSDDTPTVNALISPVDAVKHVYVHYRKTGDTTWLPEGAPGGALKEIPKAEKISYTFEDEKPTLEPGAEYEYQFIIVSEGPTSSDSDDEYTYTDIKTFKVPGGAGSDEPAGSTPTGTGVITGVVVNGTGEETSVLLSIESGNQIIDYRVMKIPAGSTVTATPFENLPEGTYNVVLSTLDKKFIDTKLLDVGKGQSKSAEFVLKSGELRSIVDVKAGAPAVAVGGLGNIITTSEETQAKAGTISVEVRLDVEKTDASSAENQIVIQQINQLLDSDESLDMVLDITLTKVVTNNLGQPTESVDVENIGSSNSQVLEIAVPYDNTNVSVNVYRVHDGIASELTRLEARPTGSFTDGTYYEGDKYIYIYASGFSAYAIVKKPKVVPNSGGSGSGSGSGDGGSDGDSGSSGAGAGTGSGTRVNPPKTGAPEPVSGKIPAFTMEAIVETKKSFKKKTKEKEL